MFNPFQNMADTVRSFNEFRQNFKGDPGAQVQQMLNSGQMSQEQLNQILPMAQQLYNMLGGGKK